MTNLWLGACTATMATGALSSSLAIHGIEWAANLGINHYNQKNPEKQKEMFKIPEN